MISTPYPRGGGLPRNARVDRLGYAANGEAFAIMPVRPLKLAGRAAEAMRRRNVRDLSRRSAFGAIAAAAVVPGVALAMPAADPSSLTDYGRQFDEMHAEL